jgi:dihydroorotate dehydrogenase
MYKHIIRPILFVFDPEKVHHFTFAILKIVFKIPFAASLTRKIYRVEDKKLERNLFGLTFKNPVGLAAGFDKNALLFNELTNFGFGFIEIGTVTPKPQEGNPKKRLFRLKEDRGIINRMGFNNDGLDVVIERLKRRNKNIVIGGNMGKNKVTPNENAVEDYLLCFNDLFDHVDYFVVNVSSPNTPDLRQLQDKEPLTNLLKLLQEENQKMALNCPNKKSKPILLKIAPDLTDDQLLDIIDIVEVTKIDGVIASNTTISREGLQSENKIQTGGLSGKPLAKRSTEVIKFLAEKSNKAFPIIGVGGIHSAKDALEKIKAGADLVQIYTGFIYEGPSLIKKINKALL